MTERWKSRSNDTFTRCVLIREVIECERILCDSQHSFRNSTREAYELRIVDVRHCDTARSLVLQFKEAILPEASSKYHNCNMMKYKRAGSGIVVGSAILCY